MTLSKILINVSEGLTVSAFVIGLIRYKKLPKELVYIVCFVGLGAFTELFTILYKAFIAKNTGPIGHFYITFSILILSLFYHNVLKGFIKNWLILGLIIAFVLFAIINPVFIQSLWDFPNILGASGAILLVVFSILFFSRILTESIIQDLAKEPLVWINSAILFYYAGNFFFYILFNLTVEYSSQIAKQIGIFYKILNISFYLLMGIVFLRAKKKAVH